MGVPPKTLVHIGGGEERVQAKLPVHRGGIQTNPPIYM